MILAYRGFAEQAGSPVQEALAALRAHPSRPGTEPALLGYAPRARMNPFQDLLYGRLAAHDVVASPVFRAEHTGALTEIAPLVRGVGVHLHWLNTVLAGARDETDARRRADAFVSGLDDLLGRGGRLMWTVHNHVPHDAVHLDAERRLQQEVADRCALVHVMHERTQDALGDSLRLPVGRTVVVPHPAYHGAYPDVVTRESARATLGLHSDEVVYTVLGAIKAYKGIEALLRGFDRLIARDGTPRRLIVAGPADAAPQTRALLSRLRRHPRVLVQGTAVPGDRVQLLLRAADAAVLPHERALNSGGALLAPTFDLPVVATRVGVLPHLLEDAFTEWIAAPDADAVADALARADRLVDPAARAAAGAFARGHAPEVVGERFAREVAGRLWA